MTTDKLIRKIKQKKDETVNSKRGVRLFKKAFGMEGLPEDQDAFLKYILEKIEKSKVNFKVNIIDSTVNIAANSNQKIDDESNNVKIKNDRIDSSQLRNELQPLIESLKIDLRKFRKRGDEENNEILRLIRTEIKKLEKDLSKEKPNSKILPITLKALYDFTVEVAGAAYAQPIISIIHKFFS